MNITKSDRYSSCINCGSKVDVLRVNLNNEQLNICIDCINEMKGRVSEINLD